MKVLNTLKKLLIAIGKWLIVFILLAFVVIWSLTYLFDIFDDTFDDTDKLYYVNVNSIELLDAPFGNTVRILAMNDTLRMVKELNDDWYKIAVGSEEYYVKELFFSWDDDFGYWDRIQITPFTKTKALINTEVTINHPDGYMEAGSSMLKNGDIIKISGYNQFMGQATYDGRVIDVQFLTVDWDSILKKYPGAL